MEHVNRERDEVLIADDEEPIREVVRGVLEDAGYEVSEAVDGLDALEQMRAGAAPRVVLLDLRMPRLDGGGVLRAVAAEPALACRHAIVMMTANLPALHPELVDLLARLDVPVLSKPFDLDALLDLVERAVHRLKRP